MSSSMFASIMCFMYLCVEAVKTADYGFFNLQCENFAEERWQAEELRATKAGAKCGKSRSSPEGVAHVPCVCTMSEPEFKNLCAKVLKQRRFKRNYIPYRMDMDINTLTQGCHDYGVEFSIKRSARKRASARSCPTVPRLYLADGFGAVFVLRPLSSGNVKLAHYVSY